MSSITCDRCQIAYPPSARFVALSRGQKTYSSSGWELSDFKPFALFCETCGAGADSGVLDEIRQLYLRACRLETSLETEAYDACNCCGVNLQEEGMYSATLTREVLREDPPVLDATDFLHLCFSCEERAARGVRGTRLTLRNGYVLRI